MDDDAAELFVGHLKRHTLAVLDLKIVGRIIQPERFVRCDLFCIVAAILQSHEHTAIFVRRNGIHQGIVHLADLKGRIGDALTMVILVDLDDLHATNRRVVIAIGNPPLLSQLDWDSQGGFSPASHRACDFHRTRRSINANYLLRVCEITSLSL